MQFLLYAIIFTNDIYEKQFFMRDSKSATLLFFFVFLLLCIVVFILLLLLLLLLCVCYFSLKQVN